MLDAELDVAQVEQAREVRPPPHVVLKPVAVGDAPEVGDVAMRDALADAVVERLALALELLGQALRAQFRYLASE
jgi:hypothetical protein